MIRRIRDLLYDQGFTISGARNKLQEIVQMERDRRRSGEVMLDGVDELEGGESLLDDFDDSTEFSESELSPSILVEGEPVNRRLELLRRELIELRELLSPVD